MFRLHYGESSLIVPVMRLVLLLVLTLGGIWGIAVLILSLDRAAPLAMPPASPIYESRAALAKLSYPLDCDATVTQLGKTRCYSRKEAQ